MQGRAKLIDLRPNDAAPQGDSLITVDVDYSPTNDAPRTSIGEDAPMNAPLETSFSPIDMIQTQISEVVPAAAPSIVPVAAPPIVLAPAATSTPKRVIDLAGALIGLTLLGPLMMVVAVLVRRDSPGPALFRQRRMGLGGRTFWVLKFRTMATDAEMRLREVESLNESGGGVLFKIRRDPRVTRLGRILRKTSLDELPQLINVLRGEMSLIGPRPLQMRDSELLLAEHPEAYSRRLSVLPGASGPWQVGGRSEVDVEGMLRLDLDYIDSWSIFGDIKIIFQTVWVVLTGRGAC
jgi:lipopolysaccharide/colanic/teichoic acid biosynthesis glycosyltransferase